MSTPHKHAAVIKAWADGATIECKPLSPPIHLNWIKVVSSTPEWRTDWEYRVKPEVVRYRLFLNLHSEGHHYVSAHYEKAAIGVRGTELSFGFVRWIGDWQEVEL